MMLQNGGRQRSAKTLAPVHGNGHRINAAGGGDNRLYAVILISARAFVNPGLNNFAIYCIGGRP